MIRNGIGYLYLVEEEITLRFNTKSKDKSIVVNDILTGVPEA